jgi:putative membrane protein
LLFLAGRQLFGSEEEAGKRDPARVLYVILGLAATFLLLGLYYVVEYLRFRYSIGAGELTFTSGVFVVKKTSIPLENIQSVHLKQGYINRLTDTYGLKVETAGTDGEELEIKAIDREQALALQDVLQSRKQHTERRDEPESDVLIVIRPMELLKLAVSENHVKTFLVILAFAFSRLDDLMQVFGDRAGKAIDERMEQVELAGRGLAMLTGVVLAVTLAVSLVRVWLRYHGMQLRLSEEGFRMQWGFLQTQRKLLQHGKVQMVSWTSNLLRDILDIRILRFFMAGEAIVGKGEQWIRLPVMREDLLRILTAAYRPDDWPSSFSVVNRAHSSYAWRPTLLVALPLCAALFAALAYWKPGLLWLPPIILAYAAVTNAVRSSKLRFWHDSDTLQVEDGVWGREHTLLNFERVQHVVVKSSPFLRSRGLATLVLHTAGKKVRLPYIPLAQANGLADLCLLRVEFEQGIPAVTV